MENLIKILTGTDFKYNSEVDYEKDGHAYCKTCNERVDSEPMDFLGNNNFIHRNDCKCKRDERLAEENRKKQRKLQRLRENCFLEQGQMTYNLETAKEFGDITILKKISKYIEHFDEMKKDNIGLMLYGNVGSGKSYLACVIANEIISRYEYNAKMRNFAQILNDLQSGGFNLDRNRYIDELTSPTLLILDDFGIERSTEYALENIYNVINARYLKAKPTIITTNIVYDKIMEKQENIMLTRIYSRLMEMCQPLRIVDSDRRKILYEKKRDKALKIMNGDD